MKFYANAAVAGEHSYIMHQLSLNSLLAIVLFLNSISAVPTELQRRSFKIHQKRYDSTASRSGAAAMGRAYRKFGFPLPEAISTDRLDRRRIVNGTTNRAKAPRISPAVSKINASAQEADVEFLSPISIGGQTVNLDFDTGSADTYVHLALGINLSADSTFSLP